MDLALELGMPFEVLASQMTEREFHVWNRYALKRLLPTRRVEYYLAQLAMIVAQTMGGAKDVKLEDFLIAFEEPSVRDGESDEMSLEEVKAAFGFNPAVKKAR